MTASNDLSELVHLADQALLSAKSEGRDRVVVWDPARSSEQAELPPGGANDIDSDGNERFESHETAPSDPTENADRSGSVTTTRR